MNRPIFLSSFFSSQFSGSKPLTSPAMRQSKHEIETLDLAGDAAVEARRIKQGNSGDSALPGEEVLPGFLRADTQRANQPDARNDNPACQRCHAPVMKERPAPSGSGPAGYFLAWACFSMYATASFTVVIFSASSSGTSMPNASSNAITSST